MGAGINLIFRWENGILFLGMGDKRVLGEDGICIIRGSQVLNLLKLPDIKYFMRSSYVPGHCHVRVRDFLMLKDLFLNTYNIPTSNTAV